MEKIQSLLGAPNVKMNQESCVKVKTAFGWKRKAGGNVINEKRATFTRDSADNDENNDLVDWMSLLPKKPALSLEDPVAKCARLKEEGIVLAESERFWEAIIKWDEAIELSPKDEKLFEMKTQALMSVGEVEPALEMAKATVNLAPTWWVAHQTLGRALANNGDIRMALTSFSRAIHLNPSDRELWEEDLMWARSLVIKLVCKERGELVPKDEESGSDDNEEQEDDDSDSDDENDDDSEDDDEGDSDKCD